MSRTDKQSRLSNLPDLTELLARYLQRQCDLHAAGFSTGESNAEVVPYEATPVHPADARTAWAEGLKALSYFSAALDTKSERAPEEWSDLVANLEPLLALPFAVGNYPQAVRNLNPLLQTSDLTRLRPAGETSEPTTTAKEAGDTSLPRVLISLAILRLKRQFESAEQLLSVVQTTAPPLWQNAMANEGAALEWHRGNAKKATAMWNSQPDSVPVLFNRGIAALFNGRTADAITYLRSAVDQIPEDSGWHHLGKLYLAVAEMRGG